MRGEADREQEGLLLLERKLVGLEQGGQVTGAPGIRQRPGGGLASRRGELFDLASTDRLPAGPRSELVELGRERDRVVADQLDERPRGVGVGRDAETLELGARPGVQIACLRHVVAKHLPLLLAELGERRAAQGFVRDEGEHRALDRVSQVARDRLDVLLPPRLDAVHDHEPAAAGSAEEAQRIAGRDRVGSARRLRCKLLDGLGIEARAQPAERAQVLRPVAAHEEIDGQQRLGRHRGQA